MNLNNIFIFMNLRTIASYLRPQIFEEKKTTKHHGRNKYNCKWTLVVVLSILFLLRHPNVLFRWDKWYSLSIPNVYKEKEKIGGKCKNHLFPSALTKIHYDKLNDMKFMQVEQRSWDLILENKIYLLKRDSIISLPDFGQGTGIDLEMFRCIVSSSIYEFRNFRSSGSSHNITKLIVGAIYRSFNRRNGLQYFGQLIYTDVHTSFTYIHTALFDISIASSESKLYSISRRRKEQEIHIILLYNNQEDRLKSVFTNFVNCKRKTGLNIFLLISVATEARSISSFREIKRSFCKENNWTYCSDIRLIKYEKSKEERITDHSGIQAAVISTLESDAILFVTNVNTDFHPRFFERCTDSIITSNWAYFPISYNLFSHGDHRPVIGGQRGRWGSDVFENVCIRNHDLMKIGSNTENVRNFTGYGEWVYDQMKRSKLYSTFRAVEPSLIGRWYWRYCYLISEETHSCKEKNEIQLGHQMQLGEAFLKLRRKKGLASFRY